MQTFAALYAELDKTTRTNRKLHALADYLRQAPPADAAWAVYFLIGRRPKRAISSRKLAEWAAEAADVPGWLFEASYFSVGDLAETIALLLPPATQSTRMALHAWVEEHLLTLASLDEPAQKKKMLSAWRQMDTTQRLVWNKLITGEFRIGVSQRLITRALADVSGAEPALVAHRLMGDWSPSAEFFRALVAREEGDSAHSRPYPFFLAYPLDKAVEKLGDPLEWLAEWKWDGIRAQVIRRGEQVFIWSRGEELVTPAFPELSAAARDLPEGCVLDGEIVAWREKAPLGFGVLQHRLGRKLVGARIIEEAPVALIAYDLLEYNGVDMRDRPLSQRRAQLAELLKSLPGQHIQLSPEVPAAAWTDLSEAMQDARKRGVEGIMLKRRSSVYRVGRKRGDWWKWKVDPYRIDAVLIYAQPGHGRRSGLFTDYTFAVWQDGGELVPIAKAYSGLTDEEIREVDRFIRTHTVERFGPVRAVTPDLVFELAFEGIQPSTRHKSGIAVRFPRIARWRKDKAPKEADTLASLKALLIGPARG
ncbi:MAG: ATP-dependent DNA ligase [Desulfobacteraceae bacterium]|nr:MAG: ATP-dependent DNA ligase [Desulfobacteraceae bacterium]